MAPAATSRPEIAPRSRRAGGAPAAEARRPRAVATPTGDDGSAFVGPLLRPLLLMLLAEEPAHGYGLMERLGQLDLRPKRATNVYRELRSLEEEGLIVSVWENTQIRGPVRRTYRLTPAGRREIKSLLPAVGTVSRALAGLIERQAQGRTTRAGSRASGRRGTGLLGLESQRPAAPRR